MGYRMGDQAAAELMIEDWARRDFRRIVTFCTGADAFQDIPFSLPYTFQALDAAFPASKFILTVRASADEWYRSLIRFHTQLLGLRDVPTEHDLRTYAYRSPGWMLRVMQVVFGGESDSLYDPARLKGVYMRHNQSVREYFRFRPGDLLELRVDDSNAMAELCAFLGRPYNGQAMPHLQSSL